MSRLKTVSRYILATFMTVAGVMHFVGPEFYMKIMPPYLPYPLALVYVSGFFESAFGLMLFVPRLAPWGAWGIFALLIAVFPANIYLYQHQEEILPNVPPLVQLLRLPLQGIFLLWAYWHTKLEKNPAPPL